MPFAIGIIVLPSESSGGEGGGEGGGSGERRW